jgi:hypothetical protein
VYIHAEAASFEISALSYYNSLNLDNPDFAPQLLLTLQAPAAKQKKKKNMTGKTSLSSMGVS